jgi:hypothetical protein
LEVFYDELLQCCRSSKQSSVKGLDHGRSKDAMTRLICMEVEKNGGKTKKYSRRDFNSTCELKNKGVDFENGNFALVGYPFLIDDKILNEKVLPAVIGNVVPETTVPKPNISLSKITQVISSL